MKNNDQVRKQIATWWRIDQYGPQITPVRVVAFTKSFVTFLQDSFFLFNGDNIVRERRESRDDIFPTFNEAKEECLRRAEDKISSYAKSLQMARNFLIQVQALEEPSDAQAKKEVEA